MKQELGDGHGAFPWLIVQPPVPTAVPQGAQLPAQEDEMQRAQPSHILSATGLLTDSYRLENNK